MLLVRATPKINAQFGAPNDVRLICLDGQGHAAAEDYGGTWGWESLKDAFRRARRADSKELIKWYKEDCMSGDKDGLDTYSWDILDVSNDLREAGFLDSEALQLPGDKTIRTSLPSTGLGLVLLAMEMWNNGTLMGLCWAQCPLSQRKTVIWLSSRFLDS